MAIDRPSQPPPDDTPAAHGNQTTHIDHPDRTPAAKTADQAAPHTETRSRRQYLSEIRSGPMVRSDTPSPDNRTASRDNNRPAGTASSNREHYGSEKRREHPRSSDEQANNRDPNHPVTQPDRSSSGPEHSRSVDHVGENGRTPDRERIDASNRSDSEDPKNERARELVPGKDQLAADPVSGEPSALNNPTERPGIPERGDHMPSTEDLGRLRSMYQEFREEQMEAAIGWERGTNVVGDKPDRSPGDISDLPPTGEQLLGMEKEGASRAEKFGKELAKGYGDVVDQVSKNVTSVEEILARPQPTGHPEVAVPTGPQTRLEIPQHGTLDASAMAEMGLVTGIVLFRTGQWIHKKVTQLREADDDGSHR